MSTLNWEVGKSLRMSRLFDQGTHRSVLVAMDHSFGGAHKGYEDPGSTIEKVLAGNPDGVIVTPGTSRMFQYRFVGRGAPAMIVSIDYVLFHGFPGDTVAVEEQGMVSTVEEAMRLGADAIKVLMIFGRKDPSMQARNFDKIGEVAEKCHTWGLPIMVEPTTWGLRFTPEKLKDVKVLRDMARIAFEFGADIVKIDAPDKPEEFQQVAESCPVPLLVLGGAKKTDTSTMLQDVLTVVRNGAAGVTFGRNVWQHPEPERMVKALKKVVHQENLEDAILDLQS
jgi:fructose-bisphosphate aldolase, class I